MKPSEPAVIRMLKKHGYTYTRQKLKHYYRTPYLLDLCYTHRIGGLPEYHYPHILKKLLKKMTPVEIAVYYGISHNAVYRWMKNHNIPVSIHPFTAEDDKYIRFNAGYVSVPEMAKKLKRSEKTIYYRMQILGVSISDAIGYTVQKLSEDIGVDQRTIRNWMYHQGLGKAEAEGTYRIAVDEISLYEWLCAGNVYRIPKIRPDQHHLREIKQDCDIRLVSSLELSTFIAKCYINPARGFPQKLITVKENGYGAIYNRKEVYAYFWEHRHKLDLQKIPKSLSYWRDLCTEWDRMYIYRDEIALYVDYAARANWFNYEQRHHAFPAPLGHGIKYYSRSAVLEWAREIGKHPKLVRHLEQTI